MSIDIDDDISRSVMAILVANTHGDIELINHLVREAIEEHGAFDLTTGMIGFFAPFVRMFAEAMGKPLDELLQELGTRLARDD